MTDTGAAWQKWLFCAVLGTAVLAAYGPALHCGFVNLDDFDYVTENRAIQHGLNGQSLRWALTTEHAANWHPLTWVSHIFDCQFYGLHPAGHHLTSLLWHATNSILLLLLLIQLTGTLWRSAFVALLFALHPLRVESVVWISERKDVLSAFFWMLSVMAYVRYAQEFKISTPKPSKRVETKRANGKVCYALALVLFALGLMAKPMLVTLPFVLLLLDYWPLRRLEFGAKFSWRPLTEKIPFFVLAAASSLITLHVQKHMGAVAPLARFSLGVRLENIPVAYTRYLARMFWPAGLAAFYPYPQWPVSGVTGAVALLAAITGLAIWRSRSQPYLAVGWFWFLGMLVPTIGLVQVGAQSMADRYTYLPSIGLWIMLVWGLHDLALSRPLLRPALAMAAGLAIAVFAFLAWRQAGVYKDSGTLWQATLRSYPNCLTAHNLLSRWLIHQGRWEEALDQCRKAHTLFPNDPTVHDDFSRIYLHEGKVDEAIAEALQSIHLQPHTEVNRLTLARAFLKRGDFAAAATSCKEAIQINPAEADAWCNLGYALLKQGQFPEASSAYQRSLELNPDLSQACEGLGNTLLRQGRTEEAMAQFERTLQLSPSFAEAHYNLAGILAAQGRLDEAIAHCQKALEIQPGVEPARQRLAALLDAKAKDSGR
jgi:tetratricopeptide (TPR) repeat protein